MRTKDGKDMDFKGRKGEDWYVYGIVRSSSSSDLYRSKSTYRKCELV